MSRRIGLIGLAAAADIQATAPACEHFKEKGIST